MAYSAANIPPSIKQFSSQGDVGLSEGSLQGRFTASRTQPGRRKALEKRSLGFLLIEIDLGSTSFCVSWEFIKKNALGSLEGAHEGCLWRRKELSSYSSQSTENPQAHSISPPSNMTPELGLPPTSQESA